jgi:hypothetical protein
MAIFRRLAVNDAAARPVAILLSLAIVGHGLYFDYSDWSWHGVVAALFCTASFFRGRLAAGLALLWLVAIVVALALAPTGGFPEIAPGTPRFAVDQQLGPPHQSFASLDAALAADLGYALPSPLRYRRDASVSVYIRGDSALYVFYAQENVIATFVGGS